MDELTLSDLAKRHAALARASLDIGRAVDSAKDTGLYIRLAEFHGKRRCCWNALYARVTVRIEDSP